MAITLLEFLFMDIYCYIQDLSLISHILVLPLRELINTTQCRGRYFANRQGVHLSSYGYKRLFQKINEVFKWMKDCADRQDLQPQDRSGMLIYDEIKIQDGLVMSIRNLKMTDWVC